MVTNLYALFLEIWESFSTSLGSLFTIFFDSSFTELLQTAVNGIPDEGAFDDLAEFAVALIASLFPNSDLTLAEFAFGTGIYIFIAFTLVKWFADLIK